MTRRFSQLKQICTAPFVIALALLLLNDFVFKAAYHNWFTGKLSDFCGLYVFAYFWTAVFPGQRKTIHILTAIAFVFWKSSFADEFIEFFSRNLYAIDRVVDVTDLMALCVLPFSFWYKPSLGRQLKIHPFPMALVAIFGMCATSVPEPTQEFDLPQYLLFRNETTTARLDSSISDHRNAYHLYVRDSVIIIDIRRIVLGQRPPVRDDYQKSEIARKVDLLLIRELEGNDSRSPDSFTARRDALLIKGSISVSLDLDTVVEKLNFRNSRLYGPFERIDPAGHVLINGKYSNGIEDSTWEFYNREGVLLTRKYFRKGELTKVVSYENGKISSDKTVKTRDEKITRKIIHVVIIVILLIAIVVRLVLNHRRTSRADAVKVTILQMIADVLLLPVASIFLAVAISSILPDAYEVNIFDIFTKLLFVYIIEALIWTFILHLIRLQSWIDIILYIVLNALVILLVEERIQLLRLIY